MSVSIHADTLSEFVLLFRNFILSREIDYVPETLLNPDLTKENIKHDIVKSICVNMHKILNSYARKHIRCIEIQFPFVTDSYCKDDNFTFVMIFDTNELKENREYSPLFDRNHEDLISGIDIIKIINLPQWQIIRSSPNNPYQKIEYCGSHNCYPIYNVVL